MRRTLLVALSCSLLPAAAAFAGEHGEDSPDKVPGPCAKDASSACPGMHPGDGKFGPCMKENLDKLSKDCRDLISSWMAGEKRENACRDAVEKACPGMHPGDGKFGACVKAQQSELPENCAGMIAKKLEENKGGVPPALEACKAAAQKVCPGLVPGDGKFGPCIKEHRAELPSCQAAPGNWEGKKGGK